MTPPRAAAQAKATAGGHHLLLTGATGFVGQAVLERLLSSHPDTRISLLIRTKGSAAGEARLKTLLRKPVFRRWREEVGDEELERIVAERVNVVEGGLTSIGSLPADIDIVVHGASTVSFDPPIDEAFETNVDGATGLYDALLASGADPHVVHVSTAYVGGIRKGTVAEAALQHDLDWRAENAAAKVARAQVEMASRQPEILRSFLAKARARHGKVGPQAVARATEEARIAWVTSQLVDQGRLRAESLGWTDVYTLTKAFAERAAEEMWAQAGHRLSIVRPSIIESSLKHPFPGWIDGFKVADPLILAYGRGLLPEFPGVPDSVLDVIPVDHVVNAILAVAGRPAERAVPEYFHVSSGASNPLPLHAMYENVKEFFTRTPMPRDGGHIEVPSWRFPGGRRIARSLELRSRVTDATAATVAHLPPNRRTRLWLQAVQQRQNELDSLKTYADLYRAYVQTEIIFDDSHTRALHESLPEESKEELGFDVTAIDWHEYFQTVHFPAITGMTRAFAVRPTAQVRPKRALPVSTDVLAVFDFEGTVVESNLVEQYLWAKLGTLPKSHWPAEIASLTASLPRYLRAEQRDRGEFIRTVLRRYKGIGVADLERLVRGRFGASLRRHTLPEAVERVHEHRAAGHRTVLVTGAIRPSVEPIAHLFDEVVAGQMHAKDGVMTGYLSKPPLVDEARAAWLRSYAETHGADLSRSYGYGDSHADVAWLQLLGNPHAVNPDTELYRHAQRKKWVVDDWSRRSANGSLARKKLATQAALEKGERSASDDVRS